MNYNIPNEIVCFSKRKMHLDRNLSLSTTIGKKVNKCHHDISSLWFDVLTIDNCNRLFLCVTQPARNS